MTDNSLARIHYKTAKADLKRDLISCLVFNIAFAAFIATLTLVFGQSSFEWSDAISFVLITLLMGAYLTCTLFSTIYVFKFAWNHLGFMSILLAIVLFGVAARAAIPITAVKLITGCVKVRSLGKAIGET